MFIVSFSAVCDALDFRTSPHQKLMQKQNMSGYNAYHRFDAGVKLFAFLRRKCIMLQCKPLLPAHAPEQKFLT